VSILNSDTNLTKFSYEIGAGYQKVTDQFEEDLTEIENPNYLYRRPRNAPQDDSFDEIEGKPVSQQQLAEMGRSFKLLCRPFAHPTDFNFRYLRNKTTRVALIRVVTFILSVLVLIFMTSPDIILRLAAQDPSIDQFIRGTWLDLQSPNVIERYLFTNGGLRVLIILGVNELLLLLISVLVDYEDNSRFSRSQKSFLRKVFIYFLFNMLIVPGAAGSTVSSIYQFLKSNYNQGLYFIQQQFVVPSGDFFLSLILNLAAGAFFNQMNAIPMLFKHHLSPIGALLSQHALLHDQKWRKHEGSIFGYGGYYAQMIVVSGIAIVFQ
jgi:Calcium-dependent channel, 7TM region, putative phosphate